VIPQHFDYLTPRSVEEAVRALADSPETTRILAGGTWVVPDLNRGLIRPRRVVDLRHAGLERIALDGSTVRLGAMTTYADVVASPVVREHAALLALMAAGVTGGIQLTAQATLGGSAAAARPHSDAPAALVALRAVAVLAGRGGERRLGAGELFTGAMQTAISPGELLTGFEIPVRPRARAGYFKLKRGGSSWPIATAAVVVDLDDSGACESVSAVLGGVAAVPVTVALDAVLRGARLTPELIGAAGERAGAAVTEPWSDVLASGAYRARVAGPVLKRALSQVMLDG
jgi:carbon-monoxide dehydrogenase medium subunit